MKEKADELKEIVRNKYTEIAENTIEVNKPSCCGSGPASNEVYNIMTDDYSDIEGYQEDADLGLGCGLPTKFAGIQPGDTVIDLGSGAGNDCFIARHETGPTGKVIGIDFTEAMIQKARTNAEKMGFNNVEFRFGDIEEMPLNDSTADVIVSNCVLNLVPNKEKVFSGMYRVLREGGHFSISDIVLVGDLPHALKEDAEMYAGCVAGAIQMDEYVSHISDSGFGDVTIQKKKPIHIPKDILINYLTEDEIEKFNGKGLGIYSITVYGRKPGLKKKLNLADLAKANNCDPDSGCC